MNNERVFAMNLPYIEGALAGEEQLFDRTLVDTLGRTSQRSLLSLYGNRRLEKLDGRLVAAGRPEGLSAPAFVRRKAGFLVLGAVVGFFFLLGGQRLLALVVVAVFGFWMDFWLRSVVNRRQAAVARALPDFLWWKADFLWFAAYFGFSSLGIAGLAARWNRPGPRTAGKPLPPFGRPAPVA